MDYEYINTLMPKSPGVLMVRRPRFNYLLELSFIPPVHVVCFYCIFIYRATAPCMMGFWILMALMHTRLLLSILASSLSFRRCSIIYTQLHVQGKRLYLYQTLHRWFRAHCHSCLCVPITWTLLSAKFCPKPKLLYKQLYSVA